MEIQSVQTAKKLVHSLCSLCKEEDLQAYVYIYVTGQIWFQVNFDLTEVDSQFPLSSSSNSWIIRAKKQRK